MRGGHRAKLIQMLPGHTRHKIGLGCSSALRPFVYLAQRLHVLIESGRVVEQVLVNVLDTGWKRETFAGRDPEMPLECSSAFIARVVIVSREQNIFEAKRPA
jgi:hypothetical protein